MTHGMLQGRYRGAGGGGEGGSTESSAPKPLPFVHVNLAPYSKATLEHAHTAGAKGVRLDSALGVSLATSLKWAHEVGLKVTWLGANEASPGASALKGTREAYAACNASEKEQLYCVELSNENWPGGVFNSPSSTGKTYAEAFIANAKEWREHEVPVPLAMQVETSPVLEAQAWMNSLLSVSTANLTAALEPRAWLPSGNWITSHPYGTKMTLAQKELNTLTGSETAYRDVLGSSNWGAQRWMKQQRQIQVKTGLVVPCILSEFGASAQREGNWTRVREQAEAAWSFMKTVKEEKVTTQPTGLGAPSCPALVWYDLISWGFAGEGGAFGPESFGILKNDAVTPNEEGGGFYAKWKAGAVALG